MAGMAHPELTKAIEVIGLTELAAGLGKTYQAIRKWEAQGRLPRTEWSGETDYARQIVRMARAKGVAIRRADLLERHAADKVEPHEKRGNEALRAAIDNAADYETAKRQVRGLAARATEKAA